VLLRSSLSECPPDILLQGEAYGDPNKIPVCNMCGDEVAEDPDGFVPCECSFRLCGTCLEHVKNYEHNKCPGCTNQLKDKENCEWRLALCFSFTLVQERS
jgi:hypothetical protein